MEATAVLRCGIIRCRDLRGRQRRRPRHHRQPTAPDRRGQRRRPAVRPTEGERIRGDHGTRDPQLARRRSRTGASATEQRSPVVHHRAPARHRAVPSRHLVRNSVRDVHLPGRDHDRGPAVQRDIDLQSDPPGCRASHPLRRQRRERRRRRGGRDRHRHERPEGVGAGRRGTDGHHSPIRAVDVRPAGGPDVHRRPRQERRRISLRPRRPLRRTIRRLPASTYDVCLELSAGALFTGWRECAKAIVDARAATLVGAARASRRGARFRVRLRGRAPAVGQLVTATWRSARCRGCAGAGSNADGRARANGRRFAHRASGAVAGCDCASRCRSCPARARATRSRRRRSHRSPPVACRMATADLTVIALGAPTPARRSTSPRSSASSPSRTACST